ncbi:MAG TPA: hypothetical protein VHS59_01175 [Bacillota bacterium]|nr:hypothetical protein [Bacillota bacterium]
MITVRSAIQIGVRMVNKNPKLLLIPMGWTLASSLFLLSGLKLGAGWPLEPGFFVRFALPVSWPALDRILPIPALSPDFAPLLTGRLMGQELTFLLTVIGFILLDSLFRSWFMVALRNTFAGEKTLLLKALRQSLGYLNSFIQLRMVSLVGMLLLTAVAVSFPAVPAGFWDIPVTIGILAIVLVDMVIVYTNVPMPAALLKGIQLVVILGTPLLQFLIWGAVINAALSVPLNWGTGLIPTFLAAGLIYMYAGTILAASLMYVFTTMLMARREC